MKAKHLYYNNSIINESDYTDISEQMKIPLDVVSEVVAQAKEGKLDMSRYTGALRGRIEKFVAKLHDKPKESEAEASPQIKTVEQMDTDAAAYQIMSALIDPEKSHFIIIDGICTINPTNPPPLEKSYQVVTDVLKLRNIGSNIDDKTSWLLGSIIDELERFHGEEFEVGQICEQTEKSYNTIMTTVSVYRAFKNNRFNVSFSHHKEVHHTKIPLESKLVILKKVEELDLKAKDARELCSIVKLLDDDTTVFNLKTKEQAEDLIKAYKQNKTLFFIYDSGKWTFKKGLVMEPPQGTVVIDVKSKTIRKDNGSPVEIESADKKKKKKD